MIPDTKIIEKLIANFTEKFGEFFSSKTVAAVPWNDFFGDTYNRILQWSKKTWKWVNTAKIQIEIIIVLEDAQLCSSSRPFPQWNLNLEHVQHSKTKKQEVFWN